jgi:hypothetical protein
MTVVTLKAHYTPNKIAWDSGFFRSNEERADSKFPNTCLAILLIGDGPNAPISETLGMSTLQNTTFSYEILSKGPLGLLEVA